MKQLFFSLIDTYQNKMESRYQEQSMLTDLFTENKFWGWFGLTLIVVAIGIVLWSFYPNDEANQ